MLPSFIGQRTHEPQSSAPANHKLAQGLSRPPRKSARLEDPERKLTTSRTGCREVTGNLPLRNGSPLVTNISPLSPALSGLGLVYQRFSCTVTNAGARHRTSVEWSACAAWRPGGGASRSLRAHIRKHSGEAQVCGTVSLDTVSVATYYACKSCRSAIPNAQRYPPAARVRAVSGR